MLNLIMNNSTNGIFENSLQTRNILISWKLINRMTDWDSVCRVLENLPEPSAGRVDAPGRTGPQSGSHSEEQPGGPLDSLGPGPVQSSLPALWIFLVEETETAHPSSAGMEQVEISDKLLQSSILAEFKGFLWACGEYKSEEWHFKTLLLLTLDYLRRISVSGISFRNNVRDSY